MASISYRLFWRINALVIAVLIAVLSLTPDPEHLDTAMDWSAWIASLLFGDPTSGDKVAHFLAYSALSFFSALGFATHRGHLFWILLILISYGGALEVFQALGGARMGDALDLMANSLGTLTGVAAAVGIRGIFTAKAIYIRTPLIR